MGIGRLTAAKVRNVKKPGSYLDGMGLRLKVAVTGNKTWIYRFQLNGKSREMGLGGTASVTLKEAREHAQNARRLVKRGVDPITHRKALQHQNADANTWTFDRCAEAYIKAHSAKWSSRHATEWSVSLNRYCSPVFGNLPVADIDTGLVMQVIEPIWQTRTETASRVRGRIELILAWATVRGYREGINPAVWRAHLSTQLPKRSEIQPTVHHAAMPYQDVAEFLRVLAENPNIVSKALQFTILTAVRASESTGAIWEEIDLENAVWIIPANRMKADRQHRVPLSTQSLKLLESLPSRQGWLFPSIKYGKRVVHPSMLKLIRSHDPVITTHGFRSSFSDWCAEQTSYPRKVSEFALAHGLPDKTEAAYQRSDLLEKRRRLMQAWADHCSKVHVAADVVAIGGVK